MKRAALSSAIAIIIMLFKLSAYAQSADDKPNIQTMREEAHRLKGQAESMKSNAESQFRVDQADCYKKFLAGNCLEDARGRKNRSIQEGKALEQKANTEEREARNLELSEKSKRQAADAPRKEGEEQERIEKYQREEAQRAAKRKIEQAKRARRDTEDARLLPSRMRKQEQRMKQQQEDDKAAGERIRKYDEGERQRATRQLAQEEARKKPKPDESFLCFISFGHFCTAN